LGSEYPPSASAAGLLELVTRVADLGLAHVLHAGDQVADLADPEALRRHRLRGDDADLESSCVARVDIMTIFSRGFRLPSTTRTYGHDAAVGVVDRVEDHRAGRCVRVRR
jgi:hypothetical protein